MHQPCYRHPVKDYYILPWVRLHAVKDYYGMAKTVDRFQTTQAVFNYSGILLEQLLDYAENNAQDYYGLLSLKNPNYLKKEERDFICERFFSINFERFIRPNPRYLQLYNKKISPRMKLTAQDIGDLQAIFNLCWFHPYTVKGDKELKRLIRKGKNYTPADRKYIIEKQYQVIRKIFPLYQRLLSKKRIELSVTPHHHPIMPLLYDTDILKDTPYLKRPALRFYNPGDCDWHLSQGRAIFRQIFGRNPKGSWPSEGGVSEDVASIYAQQGFKWLATDEAILFKSLVTEYVTYDMIKNQRHLIYSPYKFRNVNIFFRDRNFSDAMSFVYQGWEDPVFAANDLLEHFKRTHYYVKDMLRERAITIIMDGENAWEYYPNNGVNFLETLYASLERSSILTTTTPARFLQRGLSKPLERLASGSWINGDFGVWIGSRANNRYWGILRRLKDTLDRFKSDPESLARAREHFRLIEGSDWYWWNTFEDFSGEFKNIFFAYVGEIYQLLGKKPPLYISK
jgi:alpha-amylase/alpha-mannosidase (GH57 family)